MLGLSSDTTSEKVTASAQPVPRQDSPDGQDNFSLQKGGSTFTQSLLESG